MFPVPTSLQTCYRHWATTVTCLRAALRPGLCVDAAIVLDTRLARLTQFQRLLREHRNVKGASAVFAVLTCEPLGPISSRRTASPSRTSYTQRQLRFGVLGLRLAAPMGTLTDET